MGLISRVSSRTYRNNYATQPDNNNNKMPLFTRQLHANPPHDDPTLPNIKTEEDYYQEWRKKKMIRECYRPLEELEAEEKLINDEYEEEKKRSAEEFEKLKAKKL